MFILSSHISIHTCTLHPICHASLCWCWINIGLHPTAWVLQCSVCPCCHNGHLHLIWSHQNVFQQHYLQILGSDSNVHASAWVQRITAWIFRQPVFADLEIPAQEQVRLVMQAADGLGLAEANNFAI